VPDRGHSRFFWKSTLAAVVEHAKKRKDTFRNKPKLNEIQA